VKYFKPRTQKPEDGVKKSGNHYFKVLHGFSFVFLKRMGNPEQIKAADILTETCEDN
jgi:hypothetical protein